MTEQEKQNQQIIEKLQKQKNSVRPSRELLSKIIAQLPASPAGRPAQEDLQPFPLFKKQHTFAWIRFAIPAGAIAVLFGVFFVSQFYAPSPNAPITPIATVQTLKPTALKTVTPVAPEESLSLAGITREERQIEQQLTYEDFFEDEFQMQEIDIALASF
jgi:hypothetical protein